MTPLEAFLLGVIQGATEFLPVSSSGHLVMGQELMRLRLPGILFEVAVHVATLLSVVVVYRNRLMELVRGTLVRPERAAWEYVGLLAVATFPVAVIGLAFGDWIEGLFQSPRAVGVALLATGAILFSSRWALGRELSPSFGVRVAILIGLAQCFALIPGISRSGTTVVTALWLGVAPVQAAAFSFLMSIPAIAGAAILQLPKLDLVGEGIGGWPLALGFVAAGVTGVLAIRLFVRMLKDRSFPMFAWYCWGVALLFLGWLALGGGVAG